VSLWWKGCDPFEWENYDKSDIVISALVGAAIPGPKDAATKIYQRYQNLRGAPRGLNRPRYSAADRATVRDIAAQAARGAGGGAAKAIYDGIENE
jgi:hypothetical protein